MPRISAFALALTLGPAVLLAGCNLFGPPPRAHSDQCNASFQPSAGMQPYDLLPNQQLGFAHRTEELYVVMQCLPHGDMGADSLGDMLDRFAALRGEGIAPSDLSYGTLNGRETASLHYGFVDDEDATPVRKLAWVSDTGSQYLVVQIWTLESDWAKHKPAIDSMVASIDYQPSQVVVPFSGGPAVEPQDTPLLQAREAHETAVRPVDLGTGSLIPPEEGAGWEVVTYESAGQTLEAYATKVKADGEKHPAVVFVEGGFGGPSLGVTQSQPAENDQSASVFADAGLVVMAPSFRGEANNPGRFELFYGETEDLLAAVQAVKQRPDVDPERVYLVGHSTGGTQVLLAAVASDDFRAAFSLGGRADLGFMRTDPYEVTPFDPNNETELRLRSAIHWTHHLKRPTWWFEGGLGYVADGVAMGQVAADAGVPMQAFVVPRGDHFTIQQPVKRMIAAQILADTAEEPSFSFSEAALHKAMSKAASPTGASVGGG